MKVVVSCLVAGIIAGLAVPAEADPLKCQRSILKESSKFARTRAKELQKCEDQKLTDALPSGTDCPGNPTTAAKLAKAEVKLRTRLDKACGGADRTCGTPDDETLAGIGWPAVCPDFQELGCTNAIAGCDDIATCLLCVENAAIDQAVGLAYDDLTEGADDLLSCQRTLGAEERKLLDATTSALRKCQDARFKGKHANPCPDPGDGKAAAKIAKAQSKFRSRVCKACGGDDRACGGAADATPQAIGFPTFCPDVGPCSDLVLTLDELVDCVACVAAFDLQCTDALATPALAAYPTGCAVQSQTGGRTLQLDARPGTDLDLGFKGFVHDLSVPLLGRMTTVVHSCTGNGNPTFGECDLLGPIANTGGPAYEFQRCSDQPWLACATDPDCTAQGATGPCRFFVGPPVPSPIAFFGTLTTCLVNEITGPVTGTLDVEDGALALDLPVTMRVHSPPSPSSARIIIPPLGPPSAGQPCPICAAGSCIDGPRDGMPCVAQGQEPMFGDDVSLDCPPDPGGLLWERSLPFALSTGTTTLAVTGSSPLCTAAGFGGVQCPCDTCNNVDADPCATDADCPDNPPGTPGICGGSRCLGGTNAGTPCTTPGFDPICDGAPCGLFGEPTKPHSCTSTCTPAVGTEGACVGTFGQQRCTPTESLRPCTVDSDCTHPGDACGYFPQPCFPPDAASSIGAPDPPVNGVFTPTLAGLRCLRPHPAAIVNSFEGLPGPGRLILPVTATFQ